MQPHRFGDFGSEMSAQPVRAARLVQIVNARFGGILAQLVDHVAYVVQQRRRDEGRGLALRLGESGGLQPVLQLIDGAQAIALAGANAVNVHQFIAKELHGGPPKAGAVRAHLKRGGPGARQNSRAFWSNPKKATV